MAARITEARSAVARAGEQAPADAGGGNGCVRLHAARFSMERHPYPRSGSDLMVNSKTFVRYGDGSSTRRSPTD